MATTNYSNNKTQGNGDKNKGKAATPEEEKLRKEEQEKAGGNENGQEKFSPSEPDDYDAEDFATD